MPRRCDIWRVGVIRQPIEDVAKAEITPETPIHWLQTGPSFTFDADPFGLWRNDHLHVFVEHYDYRTRRGTIDCIVLDAALQQIDRRRVVDEPWHLSYPQLIEADGEFLMLPESYRSGAARLYRRRAFPFVWEVVAVLDLDVPVIDATLLRHGERWWLFFSSAEDRLHRIGSLRVRWADDLAGPWHRALPDPVRLDLSGSRPGGQPFVMNGHVVLPVQDCRLTYGGAVRLLRFDRLEPDRIVVSELGSLQPQSSWAPYHAGLHTLSSAGPFTLIDAKKIDRTGRGLLIDALRWVRGRGR